MDPLAQAQLTPDVLSEVAARFGARPEGLTQLGSFENAVYAFESAEGPRVLRLVHSSHRTRAGVRAELHWLAFLEGAGLSVAGPHPSLAGELVESVVAADGSAFHASSFTRAPGERAAPHELTGDVVRAWGALLGRLRVLTGTYVPEDPRGRPDWTEDPYHVTRHAYAHLVEPGVMERYDALVERLASAPRGSGSYGLVHGDAHPGNFHLSRREDGSPLVTLFDFDDAARNFHAQDVAMAVYYGLWNVPEGEDRAAFARRFLTDLLEGYREHAELPAEDLALVPDLLKLREVMLYVVLHRHLDMQNLDEGQRLLVEGVRRGATSDEPYVDLDFTEFSRAAPMLGE
ncbi:phosphotransferase enzyme family protein [Deinococcus pimensis]|uniref:phosphotransferase enzyme family protein n=1 Tax=Deinococcus pimensis TaxID=309888 RepID=UPI000480952A|nr:phosphotransferase [Deinococcus pimensis]